MAHQYIPSFTWLMQTPSAETPVIYHLSKYIYLSVYIYSVHISNHQWLVESQLLMEQEILAQSLSLSTYFFFSFNTLTTKDISSEIVQFGLVNKNCWLMFCTPSINNPKPEKTRRYSTSN